MESKYPVDTIDSIKGPAKSSIAIGPFGSRMKSDCYVSTGVPVIRGTNLTSGRVISGDFVYITPEKADELKGSNVFDGDLVFPHRGAIGEVGLVQNGERYVLSSSLMKVTCDPDKADPLYVFYFFRSQQGRHELLKNASQVGTPGIGQPLTSLRACELPLPSPREQKRIAHILGTLDDKIELNSRMNRTLEAMAQAIFKSWFVDFEPVKAKAEARAAGASPEAIERAAMAAIAGKTEAELDQLPKSQQQSLAQTAALFPDELLQAEETLIPRGWKYRALSEVFEINPKRTLKRGSHVPYLNMKNAPTEGPHPSDVVLREFKSGTKFQNGDTLIARITPCIENGKTAFVNFLEDGEIGWGSTEFIVIRPKTPLSNEFGYHIARWPKFRLHAIQSMVGTSGRQRVSPSCFDSFSIGVPSDGVAAAFGRIASDTMQSIKANALQSQTLAETRDTLLPKLLSGELEVNEAQDNER